MGIKKDLKHVDDYVLIVDDNADTAKFIQTRVNGRGLSVRKAANSNEVLEILKTGRPRLAFVDLQIPDTNSYKLISHLKNLYKSCKDKIYICALTEGSTSDAKTRLVKARNAGADDAYPKDGLGFIGGVLYDAYYTSTKNERR
ncbi:MAG: response regulator [Candidatus Woesearchaeota archaeon]|nr:response regulator [Candidatus Woesearchaeota archaeon]